MEAGTMIKTLEESRAFFAADRFAMEACGISIDEVTQDGARCSMPLTPMHLNAGAWRRVARSIPCATPPLPWRPTPAACSP